MWYYFVVPPPLSDGQASAQGFFVCFRPEGGAREQQQQHKGLHNKTKMRRPTSSRVGLCSQATSHDGEWGGWGQERERREGGQRKRGR